MRSRLLLVIVGSVVVLASACNSSSKGSSQATAPVIADPGAAGASSAARTGASAAGPTGVGSAASGGSTGSTGSTGSALGATVSPAGPKIISTADLDVQVTPGSLAQVFSRMAVVAAGAGGFVSDSSTTFGGPDQSARLVIRVPASQLQSVMSELGSFGKVTSESISGQDVTTTVADNQAELTTLGDEADAARTLLARASTIGDILAIQDQVFALQTQIQQLSAQEAALDGEVSYATVSVDVTPAPVPAPRVHREPTAERSWRLAESNSAAVARGVVLAVGWLTPLLILAAVAAIPAALWWRRRRRPDPAV